MNELYRYERAPRLLPYSFHNGRPQGEGTSDPGTGPSLEGNHADI